MGGSNIGPFIYQNSSIGLWQPKVAEVSLFQVGNKEYKMKHRLIQLSKDKDNHLQLSLVKKGR